jgi:3-phenylpropionate/trans-cinnamate dioxygenase ferredoxin reductase subunit
MAKLHALKVSDAIGHARSGQLLLDAVLESGLNMPHDCRAGRCGSCLTKLCAGITIGGESNQPGMIYACQALVFSDCAIEIEQLPPVMCMRGEVSAVDEIAAGIFELKIAPESQIDIWPGQYCKFTFKGFPARIFSPTSPLDAIEAADGLIRLNVKRVHEGRVTTQLGRTIKAGHKVHIEGPYGHAFLRPHQTSRLVMVGSGTGFAPIWALATAALRENPAREIVLIAASRTEEAFYMSQALLHAAKYNGVHVVASVAGMTLDGQKLTKSRAINHIPALDASDVLYAAGAPALVDAVAALAVKAGASFYADPFDSQNEVQDGWLQSAKAWLLTG